jgi:hypothetical protein
MALRVPADGSWRGGVGSVTVNVHELANPENRRMKKSPVLDSMYEVSRKIRLRGKLSEKVVWFIFYVGA